MRALKKIMAALALTAVLAGCSGGGVLSSLKGGSTSAQSISRPAVESAELQFAHPAAGDTIAVFDTSAGIWNGSRYPAETTDKLHHYSGALCAAADASGECASVFYVMETLPGADSVTQELTDQMTAAGWRAEVISAYQTAGGAPYLDYTDTVFGQVYEGMDVVDAIARTGVDEAQRPTEPITINSVTITKYE